MTAVPTLGNDRDAGVVDEICGYLTEEPPRSYFLLRVPVPVKLVLWLKFFGDLPASSNTIKAIS